MVAERVNSAFFVFPGLLSVETLRNESVRILEVRSHLGHDTRQRLASGTGYSQHCWRSIRAELVALQDALPHSYCPVEPAGSEGTAVRTERDGKDGAGSGVERRELGVACQVPQLDSAVLATGG